MKRIIYTIAIVFLSISLLSCVGEDLSELSVSSAEVQKKVEQKVEQNNPVPQGCVDLGLSVYWSEKNLGAKNNVEAGDTYSIGSPLTDQLPSDYNIWHTKYDTAVSVWGEPWRMPKESEWSELINKCTLTFETRNGVQGFMAKGPNGNTLFFPIGVIPKSPIGGYGNIGCIFWTGTNDYSYRYYCYYMYLYDDDTVKKSVQKGKINTNKTYSEGGESLYYMYYIRPVQDK